jgi:hypothetical protein
MTLTDVKVLLEDGITIGGKTVRELRETLNHGDVMTRLSNLRNPTQDIYIDEKLVLDTHYALMRDTLDPAQCGCRRTINVSIS